MKLIREEVQEMNYIIKEEKGIDGKAKKNYYVQGIFMQSDKQNRNGRVYPFDILQKEVERYNKEYVTKNRAMGELGHPDTPSINLDRVSHLITDLRPDGKNFMGKAKILDTPMGNIVKGLLEGGAKFGASTRGIGSLKPHNGYQLVQEDFKLATTDIVADPSAPEAFVEGICENKEWIFENGMWKEADFDRAKKTIKTVSKREIESVALKLFENYISKL
jgi:hypothetical protein